MTVSVAVHGATGRLGSHIVDLLDREDGFEVVAKLSRNTPPEAMRGADVLVDVSEISASERIVPVALAEGLDVVVGTSGWDRAKLDALRESIPDGRSVLVIPNFSIGSVLATHLATVCAKWYDSVEILEAHHERKVDAPSGTATRTAERIADARTAVGSPPYAPPTPDQPGRGAVVDGIPVHAMRLRAVVADQRVIFGGTGELVEIHHETMSSDAYDRGVMLAVSEAPNRQGLTVGLDALLGIGGADETGRANG